MLRGRRQIMLDDSDVHHHRHSKAAVGGVAALAIGDPRCFVSVDAMHQGPAWRGSGDRDRRTGRVKNGTFLARIQPMVNARARPRYRRKRSRMKSLNRMVCGVIALLTLSAAASGQAAAAGTRSWWACFRSARRCRIFVALERGFF